MHLALQWFTVMLYFTDKQSSCSDFDLDGTSLFNVQAVNHSVAEETEPEDQKSGPTNWL